MPINPEVPAVGVPALTRAGLHHNFSQAREQLLEHMGRMDGMHTRIQVLEAVHGGDIGTIMARIEALEGTDAINDIRIDRHRRRLRALENAVIRILLFLGRPLSWLRSTP